MTELDFTFERQIELERKSALKQGIEQGIEQERAESIRNMIGFSAEMNLPYDVVLEKVMQTYNIGPSKAQELMDKYYKKA